MPYYKTSYLSLFLLYHILALHYLSTKNHETQYNPRNPWFAHITSRMSDEHLNAACQRLMEKYPACFLNDKQCTFSTPMRLFQLKDKPVALMTMYTPSPGSEVQKISIAGHTHSGRYRGNSSTTGTFVKMLSEGLVAQLKPLAREKGRRLELGRWVHV
jgi:hypothetical protein